MKNITFSTIIAFITIFKDLNLIIQILELASDNTLFSHIKLLLKYSKWIFKIVLMTTCVSSVIFSPHFYSPHIHKLSNLFVFI